MKLVISLFLIFISFNVCACHLKRPIVNLSGSLSFIIAKLGLEKDPNLKAVSSFFYRDDEAKIIGVDLLMGGIFLSPKEIKKYKNTVFLIDESKELRSQLKKLGMKSDELMTRDLKPIEAIEASLKKIKPYIKNCQKNITLINKYAQKLLKEVKEIKWEGRKLLFFIGQIENKFPQTMMNNDGFVKYLRDDLGVTGYPAEVAYSGWSQRILTKLLDNQTFVYGLVADKTYGHGRAMFTNKGDNKWNARSRHLLVPGFGQLKFLGDLASHIWAMENLKNK